MACLHCHSCDWSQDDFYSKSYNLWTKIRDDFKWLAKPRIIEFDGAAIDASHPIKYTHVPVIRIKGGERNKHMFKCLSWNWLLLEIVKNIKVWRKTKWKTWGDWKRDRKTAVCPECGARNFDID